MSPSTAARNVSLDYVRATALVLMCLIHMWRWMLKWGGFDVYALAIGEASPCLFFVAFGMTQHLVVARPDAEKRQYFLILGVIAVLHCYYSSPSLGWEFFLFLWASALLVLLGDQLGLRPPQFLWLAAALAVLNVFLPLGVNFWVKLEIVDPYIHFTDTDAAIAFANRLWILPGPFFPLPWALLVFFGFGIGLGYPRRVAPALLWALALTLSVAVLRVLAGRWPQVAVAHHLALSKWGATSTYLLAGAASTLLLLGTFRALHTVNVVRRFVYPVARFLSDHLLEGTVFHYLVVALLILPVFGWTGGGIGPRARLSAVLLATVLNVIVLVGGLKLAVSAWALVRNALAAWIGDIAIERVAWAALAWLVLVHVMHVLGAFQDFFVRRWLAYGAMLMLALAYGDARNRRRTHQGKAAVVVALDRRIPSVG